MTVRLPIPLFVSALLLSSVGFVSAAHADPPPNGNHHAGATGTPPAGGQHGTAPAAGGAPANNNMAAHGAPPANNAPNAQNRGGGPGLDIHAGVNLNVGGGPPMGVGRSCAAPPSSTTTTCARKRTCASRSATRLVATRPSGTPQRYQREVDHRRALEARWGADFYYRPECRYEIGIDANRTARLERIIDIAEDNHDLALAARARGILARENARHAREMIALRVRLGYQ